MGGGERIAVGEAAMKDGKVVLLDNGSDLTPQQILAALLHDPGLEEIEAIQIGLLFKDGSVQWKWSTQLKSQRLLVLECGKMDLMESMRR